MGPQAGTALMDSISAQTIVKKDQDHLSVIMMSFPKHMADRTSFLEKLTSTNPSYNIANAIKKLEVAGANVIGIACNTAYCPEIFNTILDQLKKVKFKSKLLHLPYETCKVIRKNHPHIRKVGLMATNGTCNNGVYQNLLEKEGYSVITADPNFQNEVIHRMIYDINFGIKSNPAMITPKVYELWTKSMNFFRRQGVEAIILGCTELSLVQRQFPESQIVVIDSTESLASALIRECLTPSSQIMT